MLLADDQAGKVYELGGDESFSVAGLAAEISKSTGREATYRDLPVDEYTRVLVQAGLEEQYAAALAESDLGIARGDLLVTSGDLSRLIGRPTTSMAQAVQSAATAGRSRGLIRQTVD